ncbi:MAG: ATP--guanido phosphotransferase [Puniceicoccales bacterium]|jgi:protein arginine kinase|nr:ATP--guanido phosphotransferase [Puniceicoccales bacterium]
MKDFAKKLFKSSDLLQESVPAVISSRIRLARNLADSKFVKYACRGDLRNVAEKCGKALLLCQNLKNGDVIDISDLLDYERMALVERHLCSQEFIVGTNESKLLLSTDRQISVMVNEEDHLRIQVFHSDLNFRVMFDIINEIDDHLSKNLDIAFDEKYGFLTSCPTNVGTGMRASVMLHLPALVITKQMNNLIIAVQKLGFVVRGLFGEGSEAQGNIFQISNQQTLGLSEVDILSRLTQIIKSIIDYEMGAREIVKKERMVWLCDFIGRAFGILRGCYLMTSADAISGIALMIFASDLGYLPNTLRNDLVQILMKIQSSHIQVLANRLLTDSEKDIKRAEIVREFFTHIPDLKFH